MYGGDMVEDACCWVGVSMKENGTLLKVDYRSAQQLFKNQTYLDHTEHIEVHHHLLREKVEHGVLQVE